jgi:hypothetical protein
MIAPELKKYVIDATQAGIGKDAIQSQLLTAGWSVSEISRAFQEIEQPVVIGQVTPVFQNGSVGNFATTQKKSQSLKKIIIGFICLVILGLGGGGAYAYYTGYFVSPEKVSTQAFTAMKDTKSVSFDSTLTIDASDMKDMIPAGLSDKATMVIKGSYDLSNTDVPKFQGDVDMQSGMFSTAFAIRFLNNILYGELTKLRIPDVPLPVDMNQYVNKWYSFDYTSIKDSPFAESIPTGDVQSLMLTFTPEQKLKIEEMYKNAHLIKNVQKLKMEKIDGVYSYHFSFELDQEGVKKYFIDVMNFMGSVDTQDSQNVFKEIETEQFDRLLSTVHNFSGEVWIGRSDNLLRKLAFSFDIQDKDLLPGALKFSYVSSYTDWNKPIDIQAPAESIDIKSLLESSLGDIQMKTENAQIKSIMASARAQAMLYIDSHNNSFKGFCLSPDMRENFKQMKEIDIPISNVICKETTDAYAMSVKLPDDTFMCVDSTGALGTIEKHITTTVCGIK